MRKTTLCLTAVAVLLGAASAMALDGRTINVTPVAEENVYAPVSVPYDGEAPGGRIEVINEATGESAPATVGGGKLTFIPSSIEGGEAQSYRVVVHPTNNPPRVRLELDEDEGQVRVYLRDEHFTTYNFGPEMRMPILWPVRAEGGIDITRNFPLGEDEPVESTDHPHHMSMYVTHGDVNGYDFWHSETKLSRNVEVESGDAYGIIRAENQWVAEDDEIVLDEEREYRFYDGPASSRMFDVTVTLHANHGPVTFGDDKEGSFAFRIRPEIQGNQAGVLTNSEGAQGESEVYGTPVDWMDYSGPVEGYGNRGIALMNYPGNFRKPAWHVRDYGLCAANFFALQDVAGLDEDGSYTLEEGDSLTIIMRHYVHSGDVVEAGVAGRFAAFAYPPSASFDE